MELTSYQKQLAHEIAKTLDDLDWLSFHEDLVKQYSEEFLREKLVYVMSLPSSKIRNSRAAYYIYLVTGNAKRNRPRA
jgi:hypothetical protein